MALINCPECGRENVSDSAEMCPECGYGIKKHFDTIKEEELCLKRKQENEERARKNKQERLDKIEMPEEPRHNYVLIVISLILYILFLLMGATSEEGDGLVYFIAATYLLCFCGYFYFKRYNNKKAEYELAVKNFKRYQEAKIQEEDAYIREQLGKVTGGVKCPQCGSTNTSKISTVNRAVSVGTLGLASDKIGKQYKCKNCGRMW